MTPDGHPPRLLVSVTQIRRRLGTRMPVKSALVTEGMALSDVHVPEGAELTFAGEAESISEGVVLTGAASVPWVGCCRRCLTEVAGIASVDVREVYEVTPVDGETWPLVGDQIDLGPLLHDTALLALPLAPLCSDDCLGPSPDRFPARPELEVEVDAGDAAEIGEDIRPPLDPRWAALDDLEL